MVAPPAGDPSQSVNGENQARVLVDLLRQIKPLESERPEEIMRFFFCQTGRRVCAWFGR